MPRDAGSAPQGGAIQTGKRMPETIGANTPSDGAGAAMHRLRAAAQAGFHGWPAPGDNGRGRQRRAPPGDRYTARML